MISLYFLSMLINLNSHDSIKIEFEHYGKYFKSETYAFTNDLLYTKQVFNFNAEVTTIIDKKNANLIQYFDIYLGKYKTMVINSENLVQNRKMKNKDVSIEIIRNETKKILGYDCYKILILDRGAASNKTFELYVTEDLKNLPIKHFIQRKYDFIGFPLEITSNSINCQVISIEYNINKKDISIVNEEKYKEINSLAIQKMISKITGYPIGQFEEKLKNASN
jgi:hypothetical protein